MRKAILSVICLMMATLAALSEQPKPQRKYVIILQAGNETNEGMARAAHALLYARELAEGGYDVVLIFDGAGTGWANELRKKENPLNGHYQKIKQLGMVQEICDFCADKFDVKKRLPEEQLKLLSGDFEGHPSILKWINQGYEILIF